MILYEKDKKNDEVYDHVISHLHGLWYSSTMDTNGPIAKMVCEGNDFNGEIYEIVEYNDGYLVRLALLTAIVIILGKSYSKRH